MKQTYPLNEADLRAAYAYCVEELIRRARDEPGSEDDRYRNSTVHFLRTGGLAIALTGRYYDMIELVHNPSNEPKGWIHVYASNTLWEVSIKSFRGDAENEAILTQGVERAIDSFLGGPSLSEQRQRYLRRNVLSAVEWAPVSIREMPDHLRPFAERVLDIYSNGNVALRFEVSQYASEEMAAEFDMKCNRREVVFGDYGEVFACRVRIGTLEDGSIEWEEISKKINMAQHEAPEEN